MDDDSIDYFELVDGCYVTDVDDFEFVFDFKIHCKFIFYSFIIYLIFYYTNPKLLTVELSRLRILLLGFILIP